MNEVSELKQAHRATWASGDFDVIANLVWEVGARIVDRVGVREGEDVLDVGCGTGNAAIRAAQKGARVVGADLTPELFDAARRRAAEAGVEVEWAQGDAEDLPFDDASFDAVVSTFGCMFAPRHDVTARELARVMRPGGRMGLCNWTPEGGVGDFFRTMGAHLPPPPAFASPPVMWGDEDHVREIFESTGVELEFEREVVNLDFDSVEDAMTTYERWFGPVVKAKEALEPEGRWQALRDEMKAMFEEHNVADNGVRYPAEYLVVLGAKAP